jgi:hypothetical protein
MSCEINPRQFMDRGFVVFNLLYSFASQLFHSLSIMIKTTTYKTGINANAAIRAVIASTCIVLIGNGETNPLPDKRA